MNRKRFNLAALIGIVLVAIFTVSSAMAFELICRSEEMVANSTCDVAGVMRLIFDENDQSTIIKYLYGTNTTKDGEAGEHDYVLIRVTMSGTDVDTNIVLPKLCKDIQGTSTVFPVVVPPIIIPHMADGVGNQPLLLTSLNVEVSDTHGPSTPGGITSGDGYRDITAYVWGEGNPSQNQSFEIYITEFQEMTYNWDDRNNWPWIRIGQNQGVNLDDTIRNKTALCVNIAPEGNRPGFERNAKLIVSLNNEPKELSYTTSDNQIGHFYDSVVSQIDCKGKQIGSIDLGEGEQVGGTCDSFDNESKAGYCAGTVHQKNQLILQSTVGILEAGDYQIQAQIYVNGTYGDRGVYFSNQPIKVSGYSKVDDACNGAAINTVTGLHTYLKADGITVAVPIAPVNNQCVIENANRATSLTTGASPIIVTGNSFLYLDWPALNYDLAMVKSIIAAEGSATVSIKYTISAPPCSVLKDGEHEIGTFGCGAAKSCMFFPYVFTNELYGWECGVAVSNISQGTVIPGDMEVKFTFYAANGSEYTYTKNDFTEPVWAAYLNTPDLPFNAPAGLGWLFVESNFLLDGFEFMTDGQFGGTVHPRVLKNCADISTWK